MKRASISLPDSVYEDLSYVAERVGVSRSSLVAEMLSQALSPMTGVLRSIPDSPAPDDALRLRGESAKLIRQRLDDLRDATDDLLSPGRRLDPCGDRPAGCSCDYSTGERLPPPHGCLAHGEDADD